MLKTLRLYTHTHTHTHTHTDALDKNKNKKIYERDIYENASNYGVQNNSAITLVVLVITVIVLLILAGVTLNMLMGENGIIAKAQLAKEKTNESQEQEMENLKNLENEITTRTGESSTKLQSTILYPNGTEENPATITNNQRIEIENPYKGHNVYAVAEIYFNNVWGETGFVYEGGAYGIKATQIQGENTDKIVVQAGSAYVMTWSTSSGNGFNYNTSNVASAPFRVKVFCLD